MPHNPAAHLTDWLFDIGPLGAGGEILSWRDITAWQECVGIVLEPWEGRLIRQLSREYASMRFRAYKPDCAAPYVRRRSLEATRDRATKQFQAMLAALRARG